MKFPQRTGLRFQFRAQHFYCLKDIAISYEKRCLVPVTSDMKLERVETQFPSVGYREYLKPQHLLKVL